MILSKLIQHIRPIKVVGNVEREITGVNIDSRKIENNHLFIAIKGTQVDGHLYIEKALEKGATAVLCETLPDTLAKDVTYIFV